MLYFEIWDYISPFSAGVYWIIDFFFGRSIIVYNILGLLVSFIQAFIFNMIAQNNKFYPEHNFIPALVYAILISSFIDFFTLSPMLMGVTFVLLALNNVVSQIEFRAKKDEKLVSIGLYLGIASLFHFPLIIFGPTMILVLLLFSSTIPRRFLLIFYGWLLPPALIVLYYFLSGRLHYLWINQVMPWFYMPSINILSINSVIFLISPVLAFILFAFIRIKRRARITNYQSRLIQVILSFMLLSIIILFIEIDRYLYVLIVFVPGSAYFISFYFILAKRKIASELMFIVFISLVVGLNWLTVFKMEETMKTSYFIEKKEWKNTSVTWLGDNISAYVNAKAGTPYLNWKLSERAWNNINRYRYLSLTVRSFIEERPETIFDPDGHFSRLLDRAPVLRDYYRLSEENKYVLR